MHKLYSFRVKKAMVMAVILSFVFLSFQPAVALIPTDPFYDEQALMWGQISAAEGWEYTTGSKDVVVAIIDTGIDTSHEDLRHNLWINIHEIPDNRKDDDHNGFVDDVYGWNFVENNNDVRPSVFNNEDDKEAVRHGTIIGGLVGAEGGNKIGGVGVNWKISLMTLRAIKSNGNGALDAVVKAVNYAVNNGADIISMSFMGEETDADFYNVLRHAYKKGVLIVTAGGNYDSTLENGNLNTKPFYPACFDNQDGLGENWILTVGSVGRNNKVSDFSAYGNCIDITAPGEYIFSTERYAPQFGYPNEFGGPWFGTSFATPIVAGVAALIKSEHPEWGPKQIISTLLSSANPSQNLNTAPGLNMGRSITSAVATPKNGIVGNIFYSSGKGLWKLNINSTEKEKIASFADYVIKALNIYNNFNKEEVTVLLRKKNENLIKIFNERGAFIKEFKLPVRPANSAENIKMRFVDGYWKIVGSSYDKRKKQTIFNYYTLKNNKTEMKTVSGQVGEWAVGASGEIIFSLINSNIIKVINSKESKYELHGYERILRLNSRSPGNLLVLAEKNGGVDLISLSFVSGDYQNIPLGQKANKRWDIKSIKSGEKMYFIPFTESGGNSVVYGEDLIPVLTTHLPSNSGLTQ